MINIAGCSVHTELCVQPTTTSSELIDLLGNLQTTPAAPQLLISEALLSVCGFQPWGSQSWEGWLLFQTLLRK